MNTKEKSLDLSEAFNYPMQQGATHIIIGGILMLIPIIGWLLIFGYMVEVTRRVATEDNPTIPTWDEFGTKLTEGASMLALGLIWAFVLNLPAILLMIMASLIGFVSDTVFGPGSGNTIVMFLMLMGAILYFFAFFLLLLMHPVFIGHYAVNRNFMAGLQFIEIFGMVKRNFGAYISKSILALFFILAESLFLNISGFVTCGLGLVFAMFYVTVFQYFVWGHLYRTAAR